MGTLYKKIISLCEEKGIKGGKMCTDIGMSKGILTDLKMGRQSGISTANAQKIASYFGVSVGYLLGEEETTKEIETANESLSDIIIALSNDNELLDIVEMVTKLDTEKRNVLKSFLTTFVAE